MNDEQLARRLQELEIAERNRRLEEQRLQDEEYARYTNLSTP